jgi:hypothetical protein
VDGEEKKTFARLCNYAREEIGAAMKCDILQEKIRSYYSRTFPRMERRHVQRN